MSCRAISACPRMLHVLIHLDRHVERATSDQIAGMILTNPVVVRRMMAGLREKEILISEKGHGGGWQLAHPLSAISLLDVYEAIGSPPLFNIGPGADPADCLVEKAVDARLGLAMEEAERKLLQQFSEIWVARAYLVRNVRPARGKTLEELSGGIPAKPVIKNH